MEADWQELARIGFPPPAINHPPTPVTVLCFDTSRELLWTGNEYGRVTSFYGSELQRYSSYRGNNPSEANVRQIYPCEKGILSLGSRSVHLGERGGRTLWHLTHDLFHDLKCMIFSTRGSSIILVAGCQTQMFTVDIEKGTVVEILPAPDHYTMMKRGGQYICAATATGSVQLLDPKTFEVLKSWKAHMGWINDMDANSTFLVTCGFAPRHNYGNMPEPLAKVFDLKTLLPLPPVPFHAGAVLVRMHPRMQTTGVIASQTGQLQVVDIMNTAMVNVRQINLMDSYLNRLEIAPSGEALVLTDSMCSIHLWGSPSKAHFTNYSNPTEFADDIAHTATIDWSNGEPLNTIGMPYYRETLFSAWPTHLLSEVGAPPPKLDQMIAANLTRTDIGAWAPNPRNLYRNQVEDTRSSEKAIAAVIEGPKFLSEQAKDGHMDENGRRMSDILEALTSSNNDANSILDVPAMYRNVEIKYSKFGVDDFDFEYYNKTRFSGLETHISNSYANPLLQLLKFTPLVRNAALHHTASNCLIESCLLCEMGFLFDMLEKAQGQNCQATNLLKTFSGLQHTSSLGLLEDGSTSRPLTMMIQAANRFVLEKIVNDSRTNPPHVASMDQLFATTAMNNMRCAHCGSETVRGAGTLYHELSYPPTRTSNKNHNRSPGPAFSQILKNSVERQEQTRGWCDRCKRYQQLNVRRNIQNVPPVLMLNTGTMTVDARQLYSRPDWLPQEIGIINEQGQFFCYEGQDLKVHLQRGVYNIMVYELIGVVADIYTGDNQQSHLISMINVSPSEAESQEENSWHLFNDFLVRKVPAEEALRFDSSWKLPSVLTYQLKRYRHQIDETWKDNLDTSLLYRKWATRQQDDPSLFRTLTYQIETPRPDTPVGIDAEFVSLQQEELEIKADGTRQTLRPSRLALARVSVLRGGPDDQALVNADREGLSDDFPDGATLAYIPFVDDYIHIQEPIVDYLTAFSGIHPGDLDPASSPYASTGRLVSLKQAYKKIWLLLNLGCVFVGHGLPKDFRTINIHIPRNQVVDTVDLFFIRARQRKLSLRFLSWYLLGEVVQSQADEGGEGKGHDSVEDARTALKLWGVWKKLEAEGRTEIVVEDIYNRGRHVQFKVPLNAAPGKKGSEILASLGMRGGRNSDTSRSGTPVVPAESEDGRSAPGTPHGRFAGLVSRAAITESPSK